MPKESQENSNPRKFPGLWDRITIALDTARTGEIAAKVGVAPSSVSEWKSGPRPPSIDSLMKIAELGGVTVDWLLTGQDRQSGGNPDGEDDGGLVRSFLHTYVPDETAEKIKARAKAQKRLLKDVLIEMIEVGVVAAPLAEAVQDFGELYVAKLKQALGPKTPKKRKPARKRSKRPSAE